MTAPFENGSTVWVWPHRCPKEAIEAKVDLISKNGNSIALCLRDKPQWFRFNPGAFMTRTGELEMFLLREAIRLWTDIVNGEFYEVAKEKPGGAGEI